jgi:hypothetical protein
MERTGKEKVDRSSSEVDDEGMVWESCMRRGLLRHTNLLIRVLANDPFFLYLHND